MLNYAADKMSFKETSVLRWTTRFIKCPLRNRVFYAELRGW